MSVVNWSLNNAPIKSMIIEPIGSNQFTSEFQRARSPLFGTTRPQKFSGVQQTLLFTACLLISLFLKVFLFHDQIEIQMHH